MTSKGLTRQDSQREVRGGGEGQVMSLLASTRESSAPDVCRSFIGRSLLSTERTLHPPGSEVKQRSQRTLVYFFCVRAKVALGVIHR
jgi:hypothetical protein